MDSRFEIGIVGAGPAGARAAELLASAGASVVAWDPRAPWEKPCGGGLTDAVFRQVPELNELLPLTQEIREVRIELSPEVGFTVPLESPLRIVPRADLARWQLNRALARGATLLQLGVREIRRASSGWLVLTEDGGRAWVRFLVGADGAASLVRRVAAPSLEVELVPTRVRYPGGEGPTPHTAVMRFYEAVSGYLWDFPRRGHRSVGIGLPGRGWSRGRFDSEIDAHVASVQGCSCAPGVRAGAVIGTAGWGHGDYNLVGKADYALLGDAAGFADPTTGEGIQNALVSAGLLAMAWEDAADFSGYPALARSAFEREFRLARRVRRLLLESSAGVRAIEWAMASSSGLAALCALTNAFNEHDWRPASVLGRWWRARGVYSPNDTSIGRRIAAACECGCPDGDEVRQTNTSSLLAAASIPHGPTSMFGCLRQQEEPS